MVQYICLDCGKAFRGPELIEEFETGEHHWKSPCCHGGFVPAVICGNCDKLIAGGSDFHGLCGDCATKTISRLRYFLMNEFTESEREVLNDAFDGVALTEPEKAKVVTKW